MALSPRKKIALFSQETEDYDIYLLTVTHPEWSEPLRISTDATSIVGEDDGTGMPIYGTVSRGNTYYFLPIRANLPDSKQEGAPECTLTIDNVSRYVSPHLLSVQSINPRVTVEVVNSFDTDTVDMVWPELDLSTATVTQDSVEVKLAMDMAQNEPVPWLRFVPAYFPNLFD